MTCERCGERPGTIRFTEYVDGEARRMRICPQCADELGFGSEPGDPEEGAATGKLHGVVSIEAVLQGKGGSEEDDAPETDDRRCPGCGLTGPELRRVSLFGCETCYETFADTLDPLFQRVHGAVRHRGRLPGGASAGPEDPEATP